ncbi:SecDF P1 head subdomain-containing protein [Yinghuangia seranimata]|uniref:SecDF P1 head subdomain-containing protein n=1 Tax=Yinghuangia seranimata TaxID=408067 RepID=UPI00248AD815|nr:hypothetical protein [Yinghuangia seranimata]MDI2132579.1 hypothetical protein [Yinghuangia seranimata]
MRHVPRRRLAVRPALLLAAVLACVPAAAGCSSADHKGTGDADVATPVGQDLADVVLTPETPLSKAALQTAADTIRKRAEALGLRVTYAKPTDTAVSVRLSVRGLGQGAEDRVAQLGRSGTIAFRPVVASAGIAANAPRDGSVPPDSAQAFDALDCGSASTPSAESPTSVLLACDKDDNEKFVLAPVALDGRDVRSAAADFSDQGVGGWQIRVAFTDAGTKRFADLTARLAERQEPTARIAIVSRGVVLSAPAVHAPIPGGEAVVTGGFTEKSAKELAALINAGTLPVAFSMTSYVHTT